MSAVFIAESGEMATRYGGAAEAVSFIKIWRIFA